MENVSHNPKIMGGEQVTVRKRSGGRKKDPNSMLPPNTLNNKKRKEEGSRGEGPAGGKGWRT